MQWITEVETIKRKTWALSLVSRSKSVGAGLAYSLLAARPLCLWHNSCSWSCRPKRYI